ncbi:MAG TPA: carbonic anhydrase family protein [Planctomycetota bacterium]
MEARLKRLPPFVVLALLAGCAHTDRSVADAAHKDGHPHWSYEGATGPAHWGSLAPEYALCSAGRQQSPVDIAQPASVDLPNLELHYAPTKVAIVNNGHTIQVDYAPGSWMQVDGTRYELLQFHFHAPSEHTVAGRHAAAEMHFVHKSATGSLAVVGVMLEEGEANSRFDAVWSHLPATPGPAQQFDVQIDADDLLPQDQRTYRYLGSLTTPPGSEGVSWFLMQEPVRLSKAQIAAFTRIYRGNNRPTQPLHGRTVRLDSSR